MSEYASVAERARRAFASVARLESALTRSPDDAGLQINLASRMKLARQFEGQLREVARNAHVELCNYRIIPEATDRYYVPHVTKSLSEYQNVFTQIHDAIVNGPKTRATFGREAASESIMEIGYTYSGSLGIVLMAPSKRDLLAGKLDTSIDALFQVLDIQDQDNVRDIAKSLGEAVVKRVHDWSKSNVEGGFAVDVRWNRVDGKQQGQVVPRGAMERIVEIIEATSDEKSKIVTVDGMLVGVNLKAGNFHFVIPEGDDYRGQLDDAFDRNGVVTVGKRYKATIRNVSKVTYATGHEEHRHQLIKLENERTA